MPRWLPCVALLIAGASAIAVVQRADLALFSIFVGIASTAIASGLVDLSTVRERRRQAVPLRQLAGRRIGRVHQLLLEIVQVLFDDLHPTSAADWPKALRSAPEAPIDLATPAPEHPPRTRAQYLADLRTQLLTALDELRVLGAAGVLAAEANTLDQAIKGEFHSYVEAGIGTPHFRNRRVVAAAAATLIEYVQTTTATAAKAAGTTCNYGRA